MGFLDRTTSGRQAERNGKFRHRGEKKNPLVPGDGDGKERNIHQRLSRRSEGRKQTYAVPGKEYIAAIEGLDHYLTEGSGNRSRHSTENQFKKKTVGDNHSERGLDIKSWGKGA